MWEELERRGATAAEVRFTGRAGEGGRIGTITLSCVEGNDSAQLHGSWREELDDALAAPVWNRFALFAGHPRVVAAVIWTTRDQRVVISGRRGNEPFEEVV